MDQAKPKKLNLSWLAFALLCLGFLEFVFVYLLQDKDALTSSVYTYYQSEYYVHLSKGEIPWIHFRFEYPPLAAYALLFPAFISGLSILWVSILRGASTLLLSILTLRFLNQSQTVPKHIRDLVGISVGLMAIIVPGFYFGLFDWTLVLGNILLALTLLGSGDDARKKFWPLVFGGASIKLMPLMAAPFMLLVKEVREKSNFLKSFGITALIHLPFLIFGFREFKMFVNYHRMRGIDCFSSYACLLNALEKLGKVTIIRKWNFGALELEGSLSGLFAKASMPLFLLVMACLLILTQKLVKQGMGAKTAFGMYLVAFLVYPAISKVSQSNYCLWGAACLLCFWLIGFQRQIFVRRTFVGLLALLAIGFYQDRFFAGFMLPQVPWSMIVVSTVRQILTVALAVYCLREIRQEASQFDQQGALA
jgi:hypothetical protein